MPAAGKAKGDSARTGVAFLNIPLFPLSRTLKYKLDKQYKPIGRLNLLAIQPKMRTASLDTFHKTAFRARRRRLFAPHLRAQLPELKRQMQGQPHIGSVERVVGQLLNTLQAVQQRVAMDE